MTPFALTSTPNEFAGPWRKPRNLFQDLGVKSIHNDATAQRLGLRGGTVPGNFHFEQFSPLLEAVLGAEWWRSGNLSLQFLTPTTDAEPVRAFAGSPQGRNEGGQGCQVWMTTEAGASVCTGTAAVGSPDARSELALRLAAARAPGDLRILRSIPVGRTSPSTPVRMTAEAARPRLAAITEPLDAYTTASAWGERVAPPSLAIDGMRAVESALFEGAAASVGLFGAIEVQHLNGPIFVDHDYEAVGEILALSDSPKTEIAWYASALREAGGGRQVARLLMMTRCMKASSPLWHGAGLV